MYSNVLDLSKFRKQRESKINKEKSRGLQWNSSRDLQIQKIVDSLIEALDSVESQLKTQDS